MPNKHLLGSKDDDEEPRTVHCLPPQGVELRATFHFLAMSAGLRARRVLSSDGTEGDFEVLELSISSMIPLSESELSDPESKVAFFINQPRDRCLSLFFSALRPHYSARPFGPIMLKIMLA